MPNLILRPSGRTSGKTWALQLRYHDSCGPTEYETVCLVDRDMAEEIVRAGKAEWLFGEPGPDTTGIPAPTMRAARLERPSDWPPALRLACDRMEAASDRVLNISTGNELEVALAEHTAARAEFGELLLALDKRRRPEAYRR